MIVYLEPFKPWITVKHLHLFRWKSTQNLKYFTNKCHFTPLSTLLLSYEVILELNCFGNSGLSISVIKLVSILFPYFLKLQDPGVSKHIFRKYYRRIASKSIVSIYLHVFHHSPFGHFRGDSEHSPQYSQTFPFAITIYFNKRNGNNQAW